MPYDEAAMNVCREFARKASTALKASKARPGVVFNEPYLPHIPERWNGVLILGCAESLGSKKIAREYLARLRGLDPESRFTRMELDVKDRPWDRRQFRLAIASLRPKIDFRQVAFSNAVPWSTTKLDEKGVTKDCQPTREMQCLAVQFWRSLLAVWHNEIGRLKLVITLDAVAKDPVSFIALQESLNVSVLSLYFPNHWNNIRIKKMNRHLLDNHLATVEAAAEDLCISPNEAEKLYACYAVQQAREQLGDTLGEILR